MNNNYLRQAALECGYNEPISIEPDGSIWLGTEHDRTYLTVDEQLQVVHRADQIQQNKESARQSARAKLAALGLDDEEIHALLGI